MRASIVLCVSTLTLSLSAVALPAQALPASEPLAPGVKSAGVARVGAPVTGSGQAALTPAALAMTARPSARAARLGSSIAVTGKAPARRGVAVVVQRLAGKRWVPVATGRVGARSAYLVRVRLTTPGRSALRAVVPGLRGRVAAASPAFAVRATTRPGYTALRLDPSALPTGTAGLAYRFGLTASGGTTPYRWSVRGLPAGLSATRDGAISGTPTRTGTWRGTAVLTDADGVVRSRSFSVAVPSALPAACTGRSCSQTVAASGTVAVAANQVGAIERDSSGAPVSLRLTGVSPSVGQVLVLAPSALTPTGVVVRVTGVTVNGDGTRTVSVERTSVSAAYSEGAVSTQGTPAVTLPASAAAAGLRSGRTAAGGYGPKAAPGPATTVVAPRSSLSLPTCDGGRSIDLRGLSVDPSFTPALTALWKRPLIGAGGIYVGTGGLQLFQVDLDGSIALDLGVAVSGSATCTLALPEVRTFVPAGALGSIVITLQPKLSLTVSGKVDVRTSVKLTCGMYYRWTPEGTSGTKYCGRRTEPLRVSSDSGVDVTLTASLAASVTLNELVGVDGEISASAHAGFHPLQRPAGVIDASARFELGGCLACWWADSPARVTFVSGEIFRATIATFDIVPAVTGSSAPAITTSSLPTAQPGQPYTARLLTADNRNGAWSISSGSLPAGLALVGDTITGRPIAVGTSAFTVSFVDGSGASTNRDLQITVQVGSTGVSGAVQDLGYCRDQVLAPNDDNSTDAIALPFSFTFGGYSRSEVYVSNNGYITLDYPQSTYTPYPLDGSAPQAIIAPFFADVDTRDPASSYVTYGASPDGTTFCVNWVGVGYYDTHADRLNSFQLLLRTRPDTGAGNADITFNYGGINWESGDVSGGTGGIGGTVARAGYTDGYGDQVLELTGSGVSGALLDGGVSALVSNSLNTGVAGRYVMALRG